jgi:hypothetical protein
MVGTCRSCGGHSSYSSWEPGASNVVKHLEGCLYGMVEEIVVLAAEIETSSKHIAQKERYRDRENISYDDYMRG